MSICSSRLVAGAAIALGTAFGAAPAAAQVAPVNPFSFGVSAGAAVPTGDFGDGVNTGYSVDGIINLRVPTSPVSFRGEVGYTRFGFKNGAFDEDDDFDANLNFISGVANAVFTFSAGPTAVVRPYVIGGLGLYSGRVTASGGGVTVSSDRENKLGFNGGLGLEIPLSGITGMGEVRFVSVRTKGDDDDALLPVNANHVAIRFGIRF